jgi:hypothetical protein
MVKVMQIDHGSRFHAACKAAAKHGSGISGSSGGKETTAKLTERVLHRLTLSDITLQATTNRRRYMRRGSKTPAMLMLSARLGDGIVAYTASTVVVPSALAEPSATMGRRKSHVRKLSTISLLSHQLKTTDLMGHAAAALPPKAKLVERKRNASRKE